MRTTAQAAIRQEAILKMLDEGIEISTDILSKTLECSPATIRNDLRLLEEQGLVIRTHGGAVRTDKAPVIALNMRETSGIAEKKAIAREAFRRFVQPGSTIILDAGTTNLALASVIASSGIPVNVMTNSASAIPVLLSSQDVNLIMLGGVLNRNSAAFYNGDIDKFAGKARADVFFLGFNGVHKEKGFAHAFLFEQEIKSKFISMAVQTVAVGTAPKLSRGGLWIAGHFHEVSALVTDASIEPETRAQLSENGLEVIIATTEGW